MTPVLLYTDAKRINEEKATLANVVSLYQSVYNAIKSVGVTAPTLAEIHRLVLSSINKPVGNFIYDYVANKLTDQAGPQKMNGISLNRAAIRNMIEVPNTSAIRAALEEVSGGRHQSVFIGGSKNARLDLMSLDNDTVAEALNAQQLIEQEHSYYTKTEAGAKLATGLQGVCDGLNAFDNANGRLYLKRLPISYTNRHGYLETEIPGVAVRENTFVVSEDFVNLCEREGRLVGL